MARPQNSDYPQYFEGYIQQVKEDDLMEAFKIQLPVIESFLSSITEERSGFSYAPGKWTIRELLQHCIDAERVFNYRALCFGRKEEVSLPSFDEDSYAQHSNANARSWKSLSTEFINLRISTQDLFRSFTPEMMQAKGMANNKEASVLSLGYISVGHLYHHMNIIKERYNN
ncbi:DinB family protein [soil metagenome]